MEPKKCDTCGKMVEPPNHPHCVTDCTDCGRETFQADRTEDGKGLKVPEGGAIRLTIPRGWLKMSLDSSKTHGGFFRSGIAWFFNDLISADVARKQEDIPTMLKSFRDASDAILKKSTIFAGLDLEVEADAEEAWRRSESAAFSIEKYAMRAGAVSLFVEQAITNGDAQAATLWSTRLMIERIMMVFKQSMEETFWRGYNLQALRDVLKLWEREQANAKEEFWQEKLAENALILSQLFTFPVVILKEKAYVGGKGIDNKGGQLLDFIVQNDLTRNTALIEIKTPATLLLGDEYRTGTWQPGAEITGAVAQVTRYRDTLRKDFHNLRGNALDRDTADEVYDVFDPPCIVIAGNYQKEVTRAKRASFELYRAELRNVELVTYDELFAKVASLLKLLGV